MLNPVEKSLGDFRVEFGIRGSIFGWFAAKRGDEKTVATDGPPQAAHGLEGQPLDGHRSLGDEDAGLVRL
jgi:hypothetical protein